MITFEQVSFGYIEEGSTLKDLSFTIEKGSITALIGANGAGKTTLAKLIRGLIRPTSGRILFNGKDISRMNAGGTHGVFVPESGPPDLQEYGG